MRILFIFLLMLCLLWAWCLPGNEVETVSMYMYNGVKLPALPEYDMEYAYIAENAVVKGWYVLFVSDKPLVYNKLENKMIRQEGTTVMRSACSGEAWGEFASHDADSLLAPIWANYDVEDTNGDVHMEATEPAKFWAHAKSFLIGFALGLFGYDIHPDYVFDPETGLLSIYNDTGSLSYEFSENDFSLKVTEV